MMLPSALFVLLTSASLALGLPKDKCRCLPGDKCWPSTDAWNKLNSTVGGSLIKTVPIGAACHDPKYDSQACSELQDNWLLPELHSESSSSIMQMFFANKSCDAFTPRTQPCSLGNYVAYTVDVQTTEDVVAAVKFARSKNIRFVVRNTGHDVLGRSTGAGALSVWMHNLRDIEIVDDFQSADYSGPAVKIGAGVTGADLAERLDGSNLAAVTGECPSVGAAGGFLQGGGHSTLSTSFGLGADQTLTLEVVTADGKVVEASPTKNKDLYWALSGGGGGTYGVITKAVLRAHPIAKVGGGAISFLANQTTPEKYAELLTNLHEEMPKMVDHGATFVYIINSESFSISPITVVNATGDFVKETVAAPFLNLLEKANISATSQFTTLSFRDHLDSYLGPLPWGNLATTNFQVGGRMVGRKDVEDDSEGVAEAFHEVVQEGVILVGTAGKFDAPHDVTNAVYRPWRDAISHVSMLTLWSTDPEDWDEMIQAQKRMNTEFVPRVRAATPGGGHYMNEVDFREENWKREFFGANYNTLLKIKKKWDPENLFYSLKTVGSDVWNVDEHGRMCRKGSAGIGIDLDIGLDLDLDLDLGLGIL